MNREKAICFYQMVDGPSSNQHTEISADKGDAHVNEPVVQIPLEHSVK